MDRTLKRITWCKWGLKKGSETFADLPIPDICGKGERGRFCRKLPAPRLGGRAKEGWWRRGAGREGGDMELMGVEEMRSGRRDL